MSELRRHDILEPEPPADVDVTSWDVQARGGEAPQDQEQGSRGRRLVGCVASALLLAAALPAILASLNASSSSVVRQVVREALSLHGTRVAAKVRSVPTGCGNWADILIGDRCSIQTLTLDECSSLCANHGDCKGFSVRTRGCTMDGGAATDFGPCYLFKDSCDVVDSSCYDTYVMQTAPRLAEAVFGNTIISDPFQDAARGREMVDNSTNSSDPYHQDCSEIVAPPCMCGSSVCAMDERCGVGTKACEKATPTATTTPAATPECVILAGCYVDVGGNGGAVFEVTQERCIAKFTYEGTRRIAAVSAGTMRVQGWAAGTQQADGDVRFDDGNSWSKVCCPGYGGGPAACEMCPAGRASALVGRVSSCVNCTANAFSAPGASACTECDAGKHPRADFSGCASPSCCDLKFNDTAFAKCDFWGAPHCTSSFGHGSFHMSGLGVFQVAASSDGVFEVQDIQCPLQGQGPAKAAVGVGVRMGGTRLVVHQNFLYVNGTKVTASTASLLDGLRVAGDAAAPGGVLVQSDDCCYRASIRAVPSARRGPGFHHNVKVRVLEDRAAGSGVCGVGASHDTLVGSADLVFDPAVLQDVCSHCAEKPKQCSTLLPSPEPTPMPPPDLATPEAFCAQASLDGDCRADALAKAQAACAALAGTEHQDGCMVDYCLAGCDQGIVDSVIQERERTPSNCGKDDLPVIPEDDDPGLATQAAASRVVIDVNNDSFPIISQGDDLGIATPAPASGVVIEVVVNNNNNNNVNNNNDDGADNNNNNNNNNNNDDDNNNHDDDDDHDSEHDKSGGEVNNNNNNNINNNNNNNININVNINEGTTIMTTSNFVPSSG